MAAILGLRSGVAGHTSQDQYIPLRTSNESCLGLHSREINPIYIDPMILRVMEKQTRLREQAKALERRTLAAFETDVISRTWGLEGEEKLVRATTGKNMDTTEINALATAPVEVGCQTTPTETRPSTEQAITNAASVDLNKTKVLNESEPLQQQLCATEQPATSKESASFSDEPCAQVAMEQLSIPVPILQQPPLVCTWRPAASDKLWYKKADPAATSALTNESPRRVDASAVQKDLEKIVAEQAESKQNGKSQQQFWKGKKKQSMPGKSSWKSPTWPTKNKLNEAPPSPASPSDRTPFVATKPSHKSAKHTPLTSPQAQAQQYEEHKPTNEAIRASCAIYSSSTASSSTRGWVKDRTDARDLIDPNAAWNHGVAVFPANHHSSAASRTIGQNTRFVNGWLALVVRDLKGINTEINFADYQRYIRTPEPQRGNLVFDANFWARSIVPEYWKPQSVGNESPKTFWNKMLASDDFTTTDEGDLDDVNPWWIDNPTYKGAFHEPCVTPEILGVDPDETPEQRTCREQDHGSNAFAEIYRRNHANRLNNEHGRHSRFERELLKNTATSVISFQPRTAGFQARIPLLIRAARREDMLNIAAIKTHYIKNTTAAYGGDEYTEHDMSLEWQACQERGLPFLVACQPNYISKGRQSHGNGVVVPEHVIGFAVATAHHLHGAEVANNRGAQVFTDPKYTRLGVATCLLDKLLKAINPAYIEKTRCEHDLFGDGRIVSPAETVQNVWLEYMWDSEDHLRTQKIQEWLCTRLGMEHSGTGFTLSSMDDRKVDYHTFCYSYPRR